MKKVLSLSVFFLFLLFLATGCGGGGGATESQATGGDTSGNGVYLSAQSWNGSRQYSYCSNPATGTYVFTSNSGILTTLSYEGYDWHHDCTVTPYSSGVIDVSSLNLTEPLSEEALVVLFEYLYGSYGSNRFACEVVNYSNDAFSMRIIDSLDDSVEVIELSKTGSSQVPSNESDINSGLLAHYEFEGNANDSSGNGNHGVEHGGVSYTNGVIGQAGSFDGVDDYIRKSNFAISVEDFSVSMWINAASMPSWYRMAYAFHEGTPGYSNHGDLGSWFALNSDASLVGVSTVENGIFDEQINADESIESNQWYHVSMIRKNQNLTMYINGVESTPDVIRNSDYSPTIAFANGFLEIGAPNYYGEAGGWIENGRDDAKWHGEIDDFRLYNRALNETEVKELFDMGENGNGGELSPNESQGCSGSYHGTFTGNDQGTWSVNIDSNNQISGNAVSNLVGLLSVNGDITNGQMVFGGATGGSSVSFTGNIDANTGAVTGTWVTSMGNSGTFVGSRQ